MKVKELIEELLKCNPEATVAVMDGRDDYLSNPTHTIYVAVTEDKQRNIVYIEEAP